ncbi:nitroreductase family protein [Bacteroidota bacterium]
MKLLGKSFIKIAKGRYSSRIYYKKPIKREILEEILEAGRLAPSARNSQPWYVFVVQQEEMKNKITGCYSKEWIKTAPVILVVCGNHSKSWKRSDGKDHCDIDVSIFIDHLTLAATEYDLATCWICKFDVKKCAEILNLPKHVEPIALLPIGYPRDFVDFDRHREQRLSTIDFTSWEYF